MERSRKRPGRQNPKRNIEQHEQARRHRGQHAGLALPLHLIGIMRVVQLKAHAEHQRRQQHNDGHAANDAQQPGGKRNVPLRIPGKQTNQIAPDGIKQRGRVIELQVPGQIFRRQTGKYAPAHRTHIQPNRAQRQNQQDHPAASRRLVCHGAITHYLSLPNG